MGRLRRRGINILFAFTIAALITLTNDAKAQAGHAVYDAAPSPHALARHLFGPRYRSAAAPSDERFGMRIRFALDSASILDESRPLLDSVGEMLQLDGVAQQALVIEGHADTLGSEAYNLGLSERRAEAVKRYLVRHHGVAAARLVTVGHGERWLYDADDGENPINRRVEFRAVRNVLVR